MAVPFLLLAVLLLNDDAAAQEPAKPVTILGFGDSLMAGYGLPEDQGFTRQLQNALAKMGLPAEIVNAGVSGDTSAGGLARLDWTLDRDYDVILLELGANDALRGISPADTRKNLDAMLATLKSKTQARILLIGMQAPNNWGADYKRQFDAIYPDLAQKYDVALYPFFLDGVAGDLSLNQEDGIHPNPDGVAEIVKRILPLITQLVKKPQQQTLRPVDFIVILLRDSFPKG